MDDDRTRQTAPIPLLPRRTFIRGSVAVTGVTAATLAVPAAARNRQASTDLAATPEATPDLATEASPMPSGGLNESELTTLRAAIDRLIPADDLGPGAVDSGVDVYIATTLAGYGAATLPLYQQGLAALDTAAGGDGFAALDVAAQDDLRGQAEAGNLADAPAGFFGLMLEHTRQGMFGDPIYGGNKDFAGWDLLRYPGIKLVWDAEEQAIGTEIEPAHESVADLGGEAVQ